MVKKGKNAIALSLAAGMLFSNMTPIFAQSVPVLRSEQKDQLMQKAEKVLKNKSYLSHLLGTSFLYDRPTDTDQPRVSTVYKIDGKDYFEDAYLVPPSSIETTPWYQIYQVAAQARIASKGMSPEQREAKSKEIDQILKMYGIKEQNALKADGDYDGKDQWKMVKVVQASYDGNQSIYKKTGEDSSDAQALFKEMQVVKIGNNLEVLFVANEKKVSNIKSILVNKVAGKEIRPDYSTSKSENSEDQNNTLVAIPIPAELNGEELVLESISYVDNTGRNKTIGPVGLEINYKNLKKVNENYDRFGKYTRARADYWLQRADILLRFYLDEELSKDKERRKVIKESVKKLINERVSKTPSLTRVLEAAAPISEVENFYTLLEKVRERRNVISEELESNKGLMSNYTEESIAAYKKHLEEMEMQMHNFDLSDLVYAYEEMNMAYRNTWLKYDTSKLQKLLNKAEKYDSQYYTVKSFAKLTIAKENAKEWIKKNKTEQPSIDDTNKYLRELEEAIKGLEAREGQVPPVIEDKPDPSAGSEKYSVPVSDGKQTISPYLMGKAIYDSTNKKYIVEFKKKDNDFITEFQYNENDEKKPAKVLEQEVSGNNTFIKKIEVPESAVKIFGDLGLLSGSVKYLSLGYPMPGDYQLRFKLNEKQKLQESGGKTEKPTKPYEVGCTFQNKDYKEMLADQLLGVKAMYDPVRKEVTFTHYPIYEGSSIKTYITAIQYQDHTDNIVKEAEAIYEGQDKKIAKAFVLKHDMGKSNILNIPVIDRVTVEKKQGGDVEEKHYDNVKVLFKENTQEDVEAKLKELNERVKERNQLLEASFKSVKDMIAEDAKEGEDFVKTKVSAVLGESADKTDPEALKNRLNKLANASFMIQPWINLKEGLIVEEQLNKYKNDPRIDADSLKEAEKALNAVKTAIQTPMNKEEAMKQERKLNQVLNYVKHDAKKFKDKIEEAENKIASGLYEDEGVEKLKYVLYESQKAPSKKIDPQTGKSPRDNYDKGVLGFYNDIIESYEKYQNTDPSAPSGGKESPDSEDGPSPKMINLTRYGDLMERLDDVLKDLVEKSSTKFTITFKTDKKTPPKAVEIARNGKVTPPEGFEVDITEFKDPSEDKIYIFKGWQLKGIDYDFEKPVTENIELIARWALKESAVKQFEINFVSDYRPAPDKVMVDEGKTIKAPIDFEKDVTTFGKDGKTYIFKGWLDGENEFDFKAPVKSSKTLKAKWELKEEVPAPGKDEIANVKTVILHMLNAKEDKPSIGDAATWNKAKYYTKNGKTYLEGQMVPMQKIPDGVEIHGEKPTITGVVTKLEYKDGGEWKEVQVLKSEDYDFKEKNRTVKGITRFVIPVSGYAIQNHGMYIPIRMTYYTPVMDNGGELQQHSPEARFEVNFDPTRLVEGFNENDFKVDKGDLINLIEQTMGMLQNIQNKSLFNGIHETLSEAIKVEKKQDATLNEVKEAYDTLSKSVQMVPLIEQIKLLFTQAKADFDSVKPGEYTQASLKKVEGVLKEVESSYNSTLEYDKLAGFVKQLRNIRDLYRYDTSRLESRIDEAKDKLKEDISQAQKEQLQSAIIQAEAYVKEQNEKGVRAGNHVQAHMDALTKALNGESPSEPSKKTYEVSFYTPYLDAPKAVQVESGKTITSPEGFVVDQTTAVKDGITYVFKGWLGSDLKPFDFAKPITERTLLTANWEAQGEKKPESVMRKGKVYEVANESKASMLQKWFVEDVKAEQTAKGVTYTLNFKPFNADTPSVDKVSVTIDGKVYEGVVTLAANKTATVVVETDKPMQEKMLLTMRIPAMENVEQSAILKLEDAAPAPKIEKATVTFITAYGTTPAAQTIDKNTRATAPAGFELNKEFKDGNKTYIFKGWFKDGVLFDFDATTISENMTLIAKWEEKVDEKPLPTPQPPTPNPDTPKPSPSKPTPTRPGSSSGYITVVPSGSAKADTTKEKPQQKPEQKPAAPAAKFTDTAGHWAKDAIDYVVDKGYFKGTSANTFAPNKTITRADFVTVLGRMANVDQSKYTKDPFKDLGTNYYTSYVIWAAENGIVKGIGDGRFDPNRAITREEMAAIVAKFLEVQGKNLSDKSDVQFKDKDKIASWAQNAVESMAKKGIVRGMEDGTFSPKAGFTRAQVAQVLMNIDKN